MENIIAGFLFVVVFAGSSIWFIFSRKSWCSPVFARILKWGSILSLVCYVAALLIAWIHPFPGSNPDNSAVAAIIIFTGLLFSLVVNASAIMRSLLIWLQSRQQHQTLAFSQEWLVSVFVALVLLLLLSSILIPAFFKARNTAAQNACINNLRQIHDGTSTARPWAETSKEKKREMPARP